MILWPHVLPQYLMMDGYGEAASQQQLRSGMDAGPDKVRRRFTAASRPLRGKILVNQAQFSFFKNWYDNVLLGGTLRFGWVEPWSNDTITNLLTNGGFDSDTTGWTENDATLASKAGGIYGNCLEITSTGGVQQDAYQSLTLTSGNTYSLASFIKSGSAGDNLFYLIAYDGDNDISEYIQSTTLSDWTHHQLDFTAVGTSFGIYCRKYTAHAEFPGTMLFDEVSLVDITTKPAEFRFMEPPTYEAVGGAYIIINMSLEILP